MNHDENSDLYAYLESVNSLESRTIMPHRPPSLESTQAGLERIGYFETEFFKAEKPTSGKVILVAGTNGKGSVCSTLHTLLTAAGERVGLYTSPHLVETTERIRLGACDISETHFSKTHDFVAQVTEDLDLSHFEMLTLMAVHFFTSGKFVNPVQRMILEVGLGGTWDSTNAVPHDLCVITRLGFDHQNLLGSSLKEIASNKFGIVCTGATVFHLPFQDELKSLTQEAKEETRSSWNKIEVFEKKVFMSDTGEPNYKIQTKWGDAMIKLPGERGIENTSLALSVFAHLGYDPTQFLKSLALVKWPGRMEMLEGYAGPGTIFLSGDHNPQGIESLISLLKDYPKKHIRFLVGVGEEKELDGILAPLFAIENSTVYLTETPFKGRKIEAYGVWKTHAACCEEDPSKALSIMMSEMKEGDMGVVTGSLYLVGKIKKLYSKKLVMFDHVILNN